MTAAVWMLLPTPAESITSGLNGLNVLTGWEQTGASSYIYQGSTLMNIVITGKQWFGLANTVYTTVIARYEAIRIVFNPYRKILNKTRYI